MVKINPGFSQSSAAGVTQSVSLGLVRLPPRSEAAENPANSSSASITAETEASARRSDGVIQATTYDAGNRRNPAYGMTAQLQRAVNEYASNQQQQKRSEITAMLGVDYYA